MYKVAVLGDRESIIGFEALGLEIFPTDEASAADRLIHKLSARQNYAVIYITEALAEKIPDTLQKYRNRPLPAIIQIPGVRGNTGNGMKEVRRSVEKAVGSDILSNET